MKNRPLIRPGGILSWSTACLLAGGAMSLSSCDSSIRNVMEKNERGEDPVRKQLESGLVTNNFHIEKIGYYHAAVNQFYDTPYNQFRDEKWFVNGEWSMVAGPDNVEATRPNPEALKKVDTALSEEQRTASATHANSGGGFGMGNALLMYWLLSGNRGFFSPGSGYQWAQRQSPTWQRPYRDSRSSSGAGVFGRSGSSSSTGTKGGTVSSRGGFGSSDFSSSSS
ncbi:MAG: hypothetical protein QM680_01445 [Luteolibacter sp.]